MSRKWTASRKKPLVEAEINPSDFRAAYTLVREGPALADARKQVLRLLAAYTLMLLPLQVGVYVLAVRSVGLAAAITLVLSAAFAALAVAKYLGLEELLQKLPLLLVLVLVGIGLLYLAGEAPRKKDAGGFEFFGTFFIVIALVSVLGSLYQPLAAAYQTLTLKTPVRDLAFASAGLLVSLALVAVSQVLNPTTAVLLAFTLSGGYAALVVAEYVAWMRANPARSLDKDTPAASDAGNNRHQVRVLLSGLVTGFSYGLFVVLIIWQPQGPPWTDPTLLSGRLLNGITVVRIWCVVFFCIGLFGMNTSLDSLRLAKRTALTWRLAWDAVVVFLTYPNTSHPLAHQIRAKWLRPVGVRLVLSGFVLSTSTTALLVSARKPTDSAPAPKVAVVAPPVSGMTYPMTHSRPIHAMDDLTPIKRWKADSDDAPFAAPANHAPTPSVPPAAAEPDSFSAEVFVACAVILVLFSPALIYAMVFTLGMLALPHYYQRYEVPASVVPTE